VVKVIFLIIATERKPWSNILRYGPEATWLRKLPENVKVFKIFSDGSKGSSRYKNSSEVTKNELFQIDNPNISDTTVVADGNRLLFPGVSGWAGILQTTISALSYVNSNFEFDYVVRTNVSSYWNLKRLLEMLDRAPRNDLYMGVIGKSYIPKLNAEIEFISGAGIILSKDVVELILQNRDRIEADFIDDIALGILARNLNVKVTDAKRKNIGEISRLICIPLHQLSQEYHFRLRSDFNLLGFRRRKDVYLMKILHFRLRTASRKPPR
jgi:hypothetical protein